MYTDSVQLESGDSQDYLLITPDTTKWVHMLFDLDGSAITQFQLYEDCTYASTDLQTPGNNNRNSTDTSDLFIYKASTTDGVDGTLINQYKGGSATNQSRGGTGSRNDEEIILKQDATYLLRLTSGTNANLCNVRLEWYEHTNET